MEMECVLLLSDHYEWIASFYESALSHPKWSAKSALSLASHKRKGAVKLYSAQEKLRSAVLSEVLNGTDHLRGVGVLVVVPRHDLNLIGVVAATLNFCTFPSSSSQFRNNSYSTRPYRCRTKTGVRPATSPSRSTPTSVRCTARWRMGSSMLSRAARISSTSQMRRSWVGKLSHLSQLLPCSS